jgi:hypothetical protein
MKLKLKVQQNTEEVSLPKELSTPSENLGDYVWLLYGEKKIGKTSLSSHFGLTFHMMCEPGGKALSIYQRDVKSWNEFKKYVALVSKDRKFKTVTVDTADRAYDMCFKYVCMKNAIEHPSEMEWGKGWNSIKQEFASQIDLLLKCGKGVILISHAADMEIKKRTGESYNKILPTIPKQARELLEGVVDIWSYYNYEDGRRVMYVEGDDYIGAGHRIEKHFRYTNGDPIRKIEMGSNSSEAYQRFIEAFQNKTIKNIEGGTQPKKKFSIKK